MSRASPPSATLLAFLFLTSPATASLALPTRSRELHHRPLHPLVAGLDECGVGTIAGPLIAAAVLLPDDFNSPVADCKSLSRNERQSAFEHLCGVPGFLWECGEVEAAEVDRLGPQAAAHAAMELAASRLARKVGNATSIFHLVDGESVPSGLDGEAIVRGDQSEASVAAASIVASVAHEAAMVALSQQHARWELNTNLGWPSRQHMRHILAHGPSGCHRASCFPFATRGGRRMAFHPDRATYSRVQRELRRARDGGAGKPADEEDIDAETAARRRRYSELLARMPSDGALSALRAGRRAGRRRSRTPLLSAIPDEPLVLRAMYRSTQQDEAATSDVEEVWLNPSAQTGADSRTIAESIQRGDVVVCVPRVATDAELKSLLDAGINACNGQAQWSATGRNRFSVSDPNAFSQETLFNCEEILLRVLDRVDHEMPSVYKLLFEPSEEWIERQPLNAMGIKVEVPPPDHLIESCSCLRDLYAAGELEWSEGEPAINVYTHAGGFGTHKDHMALTVLIPLTSPENGDFKGGGTGFWSKRDEEMGQFEMNRDGGPTAVIRPPLGTALIFGGDLSHAGMPVESGVRSVFVASFSTRTDASPPDRVHGLQFDPSMTALRSRNLEEIKPGGGVGVAVGEPPPEARVPGSTWAPGSSSSSEGAAPEEQAPAPPKRKSARERLLELTELKELGLVTDEEYEQRRAQILAQI